MRAIETEICTDIEAYDIHQKVISEIAKKNLGAVMAEGDIATSGRLLPLAIDDTIAVLYSDDKNAKDKEIVRVKILSTRMQGTEGKAGWIKVQILNDRSLFSPID